jgi:NAD/NADP transhydrogenase beta subunit
MAPLIPSPNYQLSIPLYLGSVTFAGSIVAFSKLAGMMSSRALALPVRDQLNLSMIGVLVLGMAAFLNPSLGSVIGFDGLDPETLQLASLSSAAVVSSVLGFHLVASIGGPDMPVVITVLNSYSGWALVAGKW